MKVLYDWLAEFVELTLTPEKLRDRLSAAGIAIESLVDTGAGPMLDAEVTINRPDCLGHYGIAREAAVIERKPLRPVNRTPEAGAQLNTDPSMYGVASSGPSVQIECPELCGRYTARLLRGVNVQPSPMWLRQRLEALGHTSINNVVDATNYVMLELGQPMHAFDLSRLAEQRIVVRRARAGEKIRTLDGFERVLSPQTCVIADGLRPVAIGGVMGGAESEIDWATRDVLLESAWFDPISIRRASKSLGLRTEASMRFERGVDPEMADLASRRCATLIAELAGGEIIPGATDLYPARREPLHLSISRSGLLRLMGADIPDSEIEAILDGLGFAPRLQSGRDAERGTSASPQAVWLCTQPSWRQDVTREVDLIEEVARHFGLEKFPARLHGSPQPAARLPYAQAEDQLRDRLIGLGYHEIVTIPLVNAEEDALFRASGTQPAAIANPLAADASVLRSTGLTSMARCLAWNLNRGQRNVRLFEIGRRYGMKDGQPEEIRILTIGATGLAREKSVAESAREYEFADLKGDIDNIGELAGGLTWSEAGKIISWQSPARAVQVFLAPREAPHDGPLDTSTGDDRAARPNGKPALAIGSAGQLATRAADQFKLRQDVFLCEISLDRFLAAVGSSQQRRRYRPISRFPAVERDFALVLKDGTSFAAVRGVIESLGNTEIVSIDAVDLYRGKQMTSGNFSLLIRVTFQSQQTTLTEAQVNEFSTSILAALERQLGASLRTS